MAGNMIDAKWFWERLKELGKKQEDLAEAIGRDRSVVSKMVNAGNPRFQVDHLEPFARVLEVPVAEVVRHLGVEPGEIDRKLLTSCIVFTMQLAEKHAGDRIPRLDDIIEFGVALYQAHRAKAKRELDRQMSETFVEGALAGYG